MVWKKIKEKLVVVGISFGIIACVSVAGCARQKQDGQVTENAQISESAATQNGDGAQENAGAQNGDGAQENTGAQDSAGNQDNTGATDSGEYVYHESGMEKDKESTVYVLADAYGTPKEITVTTALKNPGKDKDIVDCSNLTELTNKEGDEEYETADDNVYVWQNHGEDIHYEGKAAADSKLPLNVKLTYYLDGKEVEADKLSGATGKVTIRFDYENLTKDGGTIVPFTAITGMSLSGDCVSNITVENGKARYVDGDYLVYGMFLPGLADVLQFDSMELTKDEDIKLEDFMEVSFDATDFKLDFTATMVSNGLLEDEQYDKITDKLDELADKLGDATGQTKDFKDKITKLKNGGKQLREGADSLSQGLQQLDDALAQLAAVNPSLTELSQSVSALSAGSKSLSEGVKQYTNGVEKACDSLTESEDNSENSTGNETEIRDLADRIRSMKQLDQKYTNFDGIQEGQTGSVSFIIETDEL